MSIRVAPEAWGQVFVVPTNVADEHLKYANGQQLKVLLYVLRHNGEDLDVRAIADGLGMPAAEVSDAMQYWTSTGLLLRDDVPAAAPETPVPYTRKGKSPGKKPKQPLPDIPDFRPTYETVAERLQEEPALAAMCREVQGILGKTIGFDTQAKLLMMHDAYGLPPEVILTIVDWSVKKGKGVSYMCKVGKNWAEEGVLTLEDANEKLERLANTDRAWNEFTSLFSVDPPKQTDKRLAFVRKWRFTYGQSPELLYHAYETMVEAIDKVNFSYMDKILTRWNEEGLRTPQDVLQAEKKTAPKTSAKRGGDNHKASYDSDKYREKAQGPIEYKGKGDQ